MYILSNKKDISMKKDKQRKLFSLSEETIQKIKEMASKTKRTYSSVLELAIEQTYEGFKKNNSI